MWKICVLMGILVVAIYAAPQAPAEDKFEPVKLRASFWFFPQLKSHFSIILCNQIEFVM